MPPSGRQAVYSKAVADSQFAPLGPTTAKWAPRQVGQTPAGVPFIDPVRLEHFVYENAGFNIYSVRLSDGSEVQLTTGGLDLASSPHVPADNLDVCVFTRSGVEKYVPIEGGTIYDTTPSTSIACFGDSITYGGHGTGATWPDLLAANLGVTVTNRGILGQSSTEIAVRQGGIVPRVQVTTNAGFIPLLASSVSTCLVVFPTAMFRVGFTCSFVGTLMGVPGTLTKSTSEVWTFTRDADGFNVDANGTNPFITTEGPTYQNQTQIFWGGRNWPSPPVVLRDELGMRNFLKPLNKRFLVLSILNNNTEIPGTAGYLGIVGINNPALAAAFPDNYFDIRRWMIDHGLAAVGLTATSDDLTAIAEDRIPPALLYDGTHPNGLGRQAIAIAIAAWLRAKGWYA
jgi:lysophospholipase L1-like esterase